MQLIKEIGFTYVSMDVERVYPSRTFCLLETYATVVAQHPLQIREVENECSPCDPSSWCCCVKMLPCYDPGFGHTVDSAQADCRSLEDKERIDDYIVANVKGGHQTINLVMEREMLRGFRQKQCFLFNLFCCLPCHCCCMLAKNSRTLRPWVFDSCAGA